MLELVLNICSIFTCASRVSPRSAAASPEASRCLLAILTGARLVTNTLLLLQVTSAGHHAYALAPQKTKKKSRCLVRFQLLVILLHLTYAYTEVPTYMLLQNSILHTFLSTLCEQKHGCFTNSSAHSTSSSTISTCTPSTSSTARREEARSEGRAGGAAKAAMPLSCCSQHQSHRQSTSVPTPLHL
jgi:hypothetical protein